MLECLRKSTTNKAIHWSVLVRASCRLNCMCTDNNFFRIRKVSNSKSTEFEKYRFPLVLNRLTFPRNEQAHNGCPRESWKGPACLPANDRRGSSALKRCQEYGAEKEEYGAVSFSQVCLFSPAPLFASLRCLRTGRNKCRYEMSVMLPRRCILVESCHVAPVRANHFYALRAVHWSGKMRENIVRRAAHLQFPRRE